MRSGGTLVALVAALLLGGLWEVAVRLLSIPQFLLPAPSTIVARFAVAWGDGTMLRHLLPTLFELVSGGVLGGLAGLALGVILGISGAARRVASPYLVAAQSTPLLALGPLFVIWFGPGAAAKIAICAIITLFPLAISTLTAVRDADPGLLELYRSLGASRRQLLFGARLPAARAGIFTGARVAATLAVVGAVVGEWLGGSAGLGVLVNLARGSLFDTPLLFAALAQIALVGIGAYALVAGTERAASRLLR